MRKLDAAVARTHRAMSTRVESAIANYELAFRMQSAVPELMDLGSETRGDEKLYGLDAPVCPTRAFSPANVCWRGGWSSGACGSSS